ncbi:MAG: lysophospholipid acyltransferase family protein [Pirellulaceae bacterium]
MLNKLGGLAIAELTRHWMATLEYRAALYDPTVDPIHPEFQGPAIFLFWHEYIPFLFYLRGNCNTALLISQHQDAEWLSQAARYMGFQTVRGSTNRGGVVALREMFRKSRIMNLAITPDGPRGPRRRLAPGPIYLSSRLGIPLIVTGLGYDRPWRNPSSWDRFAVPRPFSRARVVASPRIQIPPDLDRTELEECRVAVERLLNRLTTEAENWAESGARLTCQLPVRREGIPWWVQRRAA